MSDKDIYDKLIELLDKQEQSDSNVYKEIDKVWESYIETQNNIEYNIKR